MKPQKHGIKLDPFIKNMVHRMVGNTKVDYSKTVRIIEERILGKL